MYMPQNAVNDSMDKQCDLSKTFLENEEVEQYNTTSNMKMPNESGETILQKTMQDNLVPFQFKKSGQAINKVGAQFGNKN